MIWAWIYDVEGVNSEVSFGLSSSLNVDSFSGGFVCLIFHVLIWSNMFGELALGVNFFF